MKTSEATACGLGCLGVLTLIAAVAGATTTFVYTVIALSHEYKEDMSAYENCEAVKKWAIFIAVWTGLTVYTVFLKGKSAISDEKTIEQYAAEAALHFILAIGFGFGTMDRYWNVCHSPNASKLNHAIEIFMIYELSIAGAFVLGGIAAFILSKCTESTEKDTEETVVSARRYTPPPAADSAAFSGAQGVPGNGDDDNNV